MKMLKNKRGMEMTLGTIIIAIIVMLVAIILIMIFTGFASQVFPDIFGMASCQGRGGQCSATKIDGHTCLYQFGGCGKDNSGQDYCCIPK